MVNNRQSWVLRDGKLVEERWHKVVVGDIIKMENNQFVAVSFTVCLHTLMRWIKVYYVVKRILCHAKKKIHGYPFYWLWWHQQHFLLHLIMKALFSKEMLGMCITVKLGYSKRAYNELTLTAKWFSFPVTIFNLTDITN